MTDISMIKPSRTSPRPAAARTSPPALASGCATASGQVRPGGAALKSGGDSLGGAGRQVADSVAAVLVAPARLAVPGPCERLRGGRRAASALCRTDTASASQSTPSGPGSSSSTTRSTGVGCMANRATAVETPNECPIRSANRRPAIGVATAGGGALRCQRSVLARAAAVTGKIKRRHGPTELSQRGAEAPPCRGRRRRAVQEQRAGRGFPIPHSRDASTGSGVGCGTFTPKLGCHWRARGGQARDTRARIRFCRVRARQRSRGERRRSAPPPPGRRL